MPPQILDRIPDPDPPKTAKDEEDPEGDLSRSLPSAPQTGNLSRNRARCLKSLPGVEYVEMREANRCCGQGGSFNISNYDLSLKILDKKIQAIQETGADIVTTSCSGCLLQLLDGLHQAGLKKEAKHVVEMVSQATLL